MKKIITTLVAGAMMFGFTAPTFAAINPANIDESSSRDNIYKIVWEDVSEGTNAGVVSIFAWAHIDGTIYSVALADLRKHGDPAAAFAEIVGAQLAADQAANLVDVLGSSVTENNAQIVTVTNTITEIVTETVIDTEALDAARAEIARLTSANERLEGIIGTYTPDAAQVGEINSHEEFVSRFAEFYRENLLEGYGALPEESLRGLTGTLADIAIALHDEITDIEEELDKVHASIDGLGALGWAPSVVWEGSSVLAKAEIISAKINELVTEINDVDDYIATAVKSGAYDEVLTDLADDASALDKVTAILGVDNSILINNAFDDGQADVQVSSVRLDGKSFNSIDTTTTVAVDDIDTNNEFTVIVELSNDESIEVLLNIGQIVHNVEGVVITELVDFLNTSPVERGITTRAVSPASGFDHSLWFRDNAGDTHYIDVTAVFNAGVASVTPTFSDGTALLSTVNSAVLGSDSLWTWSSGLENSALHHVSATLARDINNALEAAYNEGYDEGYDAGYAQGWEDAVEVHGDPSN